MQSDPERQVDQLLQCLRQDKKPLGLLLGAGCPYSIRDASGTPLIPDIKGITDVVQEIICKSELAEHWKNIYKQLQDDLKRLPNIEHMLSFVRGLSDYLGNNEINGLNKRILNELENKMSDEIKNCVNKELPNKSTPYHNLAVWIGATDRSEPVEIFTTNYDLLMELALEDIRIPFFDGFVGSHQPFFDPYAIENDKLPPRWARLWKIHGSINWRSGLIDGNFKVWRSSADKDGDLVIHPSHLKYEQSRKMPYLAMMDRLKKFLSVSSSALIIIGYSFGDQHLNDVIIQGLQGSPTTIVFALMCGSLSDYTNAMMLAKERGNLSVIAKDGAVIGTKEIQWLESEEKPESNLPIGAVEWSKVTPEDTFWKPSVEIGDFKIFGSLLQDISGEKSEGHNS